MNKNDLRYLKTEKNIKTAFLICVDRQGFEKTTISDICSQGMMSRNTFYVHYEDKYTLLTSIYRDLETEFSRFAMAEVRQGYQRYDITSALSWYVGTVERNHELLRILLKCPDAELEELLRHAIILEPIRPLVPDLDRRVEELPIQLDIAYLLHSIIHFTKLWVEHYNSISTDTAAQELGRLCVGPTIFFLKKLLDPSRS